MAEDLDDGEFWLPSHFLTDDDILMDFNFPALNSGSLSSSDLEFTSGCTETESDEDDILLTGLTRSTTPSHHLDSERPLQSSKGGVLSTSPQSTLCGCVCNQGSSRESPSGPISPPLKPPQDKYDKNFNDDDTTTQNANATLDLLNKAAGEVARFKMRNEKKTGTGFFDCSQKGVLYPTPIIKPDHLAPPLYFQPQTHHFPAMVWAPSNGMQYNQPKPPPQQQNRVTKNNNNSNNNIKKKNNSNNANRPLGLPPSAWPPLQHQAPAQTQARHMAVQPMFVGAKRECNGTGVFLPRVTTPSPESRKKSDGNTTKSSKSGKASQSQQSNHRRNAGSTTSTSTTAAATKSTRMNLNEIKLPQEWVY